MGHGPSVEHCSVPGDGPHLVGSADGDGLEGLVGAHVQPGAALEHHNIVGKGGFWEGARVAPKLSAGPHRGVLETRSQATQHIPLFADGPDGDLLHLALGQARHQGDVTQTEGRYLPPRASQCDLTLPVGGNTPYVDIDPGTEPRGCVCPVTSSIFCVSQSPSWFCVRGKFCLLDKIRTGVTLCLSYGVDFNRHWVTYAGKSAAYCQPSLSVPPGTLKSTAHSDTCNTFFLGGVGVGGSNIHQ